MSIVFDVPEGMERITVAKIFAAYALGPRSFKNERCKRGPYLLDPECSLVWQLDDHNDFTLRFLPSGQAKLSSRRSHREDIEAMIVLFQRRYPTRAQRLARLNRA